MQHFPLRSSGRRILNYLDDWLILARSLDTLISHIDSLLIHLESLRLCQHATCREHSRPGLSQDRVGMRARLSRNRVGDETLPLVRSRGDESLPLVRSRGDESLPLVRSSRGQLSSLRLFQARQLCSVEGISETARTQGGDFSGITSRIITHAPAAAMAVISSPVNGVDFGMFAFRGHIEALTQPRYLQPGRRMHRLTAGE